MADPFHQLIQELGHRAVRFVVIGVAGANYFATNTGTLFTTADRDLFLPPDPDNLQRAWQGCEAAGVALWCGDEPLDSPRDRFLADAIVSRRALVRGTDEQSLRVDLTLVMADFDFETIWNERRIFVVEGVEVPVARLSHIVQSKAAVGRDKDRLFLATHADALKQLLGRD
jgi:predicted nucleotidyltransferase